MNTDCILQFQFTPASLFHQGQLQQLPLHRHGDFLIGTHSATMYKDEGRIKTFSFILPFFLSLSCTPLRKGSVCPGDAAGICMDLAPPCSPLKARGGSGCPHRGSLLSHPSELPALPSASPRVTPERVFLVTNPAPKGSDPSSWVN